MSFLKGWSGKLDRYLKTKTGIISIVVDGSDFEVVFDTSCLRINGKVCSDRGYLHSYVKLGELLHFNAERQLKPQYDKGVYVWYQATLVWVGPKPAEATNDDDDSSSEYESLNPNAPDLYCESGKVVQVVNRSTAIIKAKIEKKNILVVVERCRLFIDGQCAAKNIATHLQLGTKVFFEAYKLRSVHPCGVSYQAGMAWLTWRPDLNMKKPVHVPQLPDQLTLPPEQPNVAVAGPSSAPDPSLGPPPYTPIQAQMVDRSTNTLFTNIVPEASTSSEAPPLPGLVGLVVALPNESTAVIKSEIDNKPALVAVERCRLYVNNHICPQDITIVLRIGTPVRFESYYIGGCLPCGVEYRASLAWLGGRPQLDLPRPSHMLDLPAVLSIDLFTALHANILK